MVLAGFYISLFLTRQSKVTIQLESQTDKLLPEAEQFTPVFQWQEKLKLRGLAGLLLQIWWNSWYLYTFLLSLKEKPLFCEIENYE